MDEIARRERWKRETDELYRAIGEFVVAFELVGSALHFSITFLLQHAGLRHQPIAHIVLADLSAEQTRSLHDALIGELIQLNAKEQKIFQNVTQRYRRLIEERNDVIHSTWYIGWGSETDTDFSTASGTKHRKTKDGASVKTFQRKAAEFDALTEEARALHKIFFRLGGCFTAGRSVERNFAVDARGHVSVPPGT